LNLKTKLLLVFVALAFVPLVGVGVYGYLSGMRTVEALLREETEARVTHASTRAEGIVAALERRLSNRAHAAVARDFFGAVAAGAGPAAATEAAREHFSIFMRNNRRHVESLTGFDPAGAPLFRVSADPSNPDGTRFQSADFVSSELRYDGRVWADGPPPRRLSREPYGAALWLAVPLREQSTGRPLGALFAEVRLADVFAEADVAGGDPPAPRPPAGADAPAQRPGGLRYPLIALDAAGFVVYHTNDALKHRPVASAMPYFGEVAARMAAGESGFGYYEAPGGSLWLAAYRPAVSLPVSLAVADDYTAAVAPVRRSGLWGVGLALTAGGAALVLLTVIVGRAVESVERVARGASAIAAGELGGRIEVRSSDEMRGLAENFNRMSERLSEMIAREAESKQFESFTRLSAMLTHDLKNAITGLSILVSNMERQYHREEFRADAVESVREATEKLRRLVSRLNEPMVSLSGEYRRNMRPADIVPVIRRVLAAQVEPHGSLYRVEARLPERLVATVDPDRIENVFENLVINALEAMGAGGGSLTVEAGDDREGYVFFSVSDTGAGMSEEFVRTRLFRPFSTTKTKGIGLGLYTVREIVESHGGRIDVESKIGAGTRFRVVLPSRLFSSGERR
jgi:signal transduction histidine kinase